MHQSFGGVLFRRGGMPPRRNNRHGLFLALALGLVLLGRGLYLLVALVEKPPKDGEDNATYYPVNDRVAKFVVRKQYVHKEIYQCEYGKQEQVVSPVLFLEQFHISIGGFYLFTFWSSKQTEPFNLSDNRCLTISLRVQIYVFFLILDTF
jgi:hypothetical protein